MQGGRSGGKSWEGRRGKIGVRGRVEKVWKKERRRERENNSTQHVNTANVIWLTYSIHIIIILQKNSTQQTDGLPIVSVVAVQLIVEIPVPMITHYF